MTINACNPVKDFVIVTYKVLSSAVDSFVSVRCVFYRLDLKREEAFRGRLW